MCICFLFLPVLLEITGCEWCHWAERLAASTWSLSGWDSTLMGLGGAIEEDFKKKQKKQAIQCWLVQDGFDVHKLPTWIEGWCSMKTKRHLLAYQLHGKQWHFPFGSAWPSSKREEDHRSRSEVTLRSKCLLHVVCVVHWFVFFNVDFVSVFVNTSQKADSNMERLNLSN